MRIGIFFGGPAREREISYAGGKTAYENIDKKLFEPVLIFTDSLGNFILTNPDTLYHSGIRDFYPPIAYQQDGFQVYIESLQNQLSAQELESVMWSVGTPIEPRDFNKYFDFAFIILHGPDCEDGAVQGLLEWYKIPYMGPGLLGSAVSIDKILQNEQIARANRQQKRMLVVKWENWQANSHATIFQEVKDAVGFPLVVKAPHQGSSIGVSIVKENTVEAFEKALNQCFFAVEINATEWHKKTAEEKHAFAQQVANLDEGIGFPVFVQELNKTVYHPTELIKLLNSVNQSITVLSIHAEDQVLIEEFVSGQEFSCGVIQDDDGTVIALPPTEIAKADDNQTFDFKTKYKLNVTRKFIPVQTTLENNQKIQYNIALVFEKLGMNSVARIDGFLTPDGRVLLHDPNTLPGMSPTSLIFKQMAEIGLDVTHAITYLIRQSLRERIRTGKNTVQLRILLADLDQKIATQNSINKPLQTIEFEANQEAYVETRKTYGKLSAEGNVKPIIVVKLNTGEKYQIPFNFLFKDTVEDMIELLHKPKHPLLIETIEKARFITKRFVGNVEDVLSTPTLLTTS